MGIAPYDCFKCFARETSNNIFRDIPRGGSITKWLYSGNDLYDFKMYDSFSTCSMDAGNSVNEAMKNAYNLLERVDGYQPSN